MYKNQIVIILLLSVILTNHQVNNLGLNDFDLDLVDIISKLDNLCYKHDNCRNGQFLNRKVFCCVAMCCDWYTYIFDRNG